MLYVRGDWSKCEKERVVREQRVVKMWERACMCVGCWVIPQKVLFVF